jgi:5-methyltetrahydrofolate--homocysteine methyltransferase
MAASSNSNAREVTMRSEAMSAQKPDWREARDRMRQWWATGKADRVVAKVTAPRAGAGPREVRGTAIERHTDFETVFWNLDRDLASRFYGGEAFPVHFVDLCPASMGAFLGAELEFRDDSVWQSRLPYTWDDAERVTFDPRNRWWRFVLELTRASARRAEGRYLVTTGGAGAIADVMANLFGCEETLVAMVERPAAVRRLRDRMIGWTRRMYDELFAAVSPCQEGHVDWLRMWAPGTYDSVQCDLCLMLSPRMFDDLVMEELRRECRHLDYSFYHLDGSGALRHLDALLRIEDLDGIQWSPEPQCADDPVAFADAFRRVKGAGKKLFIPCPPDRIRPLLAAIGPEGVFLSVICKDEPAAREALRELERIGV